LINKIAVFFVIFFVLFSLTTFASQCTPNDNDEFINENNLLAHLQVLSSNQFSGRKFSTPGNKLAQDYIVSTLKELSIPAFKNTYQHNFSQKRLFQTKQGTNIIAFIEGKKHTEHYIVLSAHYDHLGSKGHKVFNGADDNASGTATLLAYADLLINKPLDYSVILLFTDGEEVNLLGAKAFISEQKQLLNRIKLNINIDMLAGNYKTKVLRYIKHDFDQILSTSGQDKFNDCLNTQAIRIKKGFNTRRRSSSLATKTNWRMASDHAVFYQNNIPFIYFGVGTHKNYHTVKDNYENINPEFFIDATKAIYQQLLFLDKNMALTDMQGI